MRILAAFVIAPITGPLIVLASSYLLDDRVYYQLILGIGATHGYSCAAIVGIPAYFLYFRKLKPMRFLPFFWFSMVYTALYFWMIGLIMFSQDVLSFPYWGLGAIFFISSGISVATFYLIAFKKYSRSL